MGSKRGVPSHCGTCASTGERLREWRIRRQRTQRDVAVRAGITQGALSNYETGKRELPLSTALAVAEALDITLGDVLEELDGVMVLSESRLARVVRALVQRPDVVALLAELLPADGGRAPYAADRMEQRALAAAIAATR
jgi:transcriptional regulator with XRE-family HTH domain